MPVGADEFKHLHATTPSEPRTRSIGAPPQDLSLSVCEESPRHELVIAARLSLCTDPAPHRLVVVLQVEAGQQEFLAQVHLKLMGDECGLQAAC